MTTDMMLALLRQMLPVLGTLAATLGWIAPEKVAPLVSSILSAIGPIMILGSTVWSVFANTKSSILTSAAQMPEVKEVVLNKNSPNSAGLEDATPANVNAK